MRQNMQKGLSEVWRLVKPLAFYYVGYYVTYFLVNMLLTGRGLDSLLQENTAVAGGICMIGGCAALLPMAGEEREAQQKERKQRLQEESRQNEDISDRNRHQGIGNRTESEKEENLQRKRGLRTELAGRKPQSYLFLIIYAAASVVFLNMLTSLLGLSGKSNTFQQVAESQYAVSLGMGLLLYAGISAAAEELLFRFILYNRLRRYSGRMVYGMVASSFLFAIYHGNIVQGAYAFVMGLLIALAYAYFDNFLAPVLFHGLGNAVIFLSGKITGVYDILFSPLSFVICGLITVAGTVYMVRKESYASRI